MRIPVFRTKARPTDKAPGRSLNVRMNAQPFVRAELEKGNVASELMASAAAFADQRYQMITQAEYNEAALEIDEGMREALDELSQTRDYRNVLDGKKLWSQNMQDIRDNVFGKVSNANLRNKIEFEFNQAEIQSRFKLKGVIDRKIIAGEQAALKARSEKIVSNLSQPGTSIDEYIGAMAKLNNAHVPGVAGGRLNGAQVTKGFAAIKKQIAENVISDYVGRHPILGLNLLDVLDGKSNDLGDAGIYPLYVLTQLDPGEANDVIISAVKNAGTLATAFDKSEKRKEDFEAEVIENAKNRLEYFSSLPPGESVKNAEITSFVFGIEDLFPDLKKPDNDFNQSAEGAVRMIRKYLYELNAVDGTLQNRFDTIDAGLDTSIFPDESRQIVFINLFDDLNYDNRNLQSAPRLTMARLQTIRHELSEDDYKTLANGIAARAKARNNSGVATMNSAMTRNINIAANNYNYEEGMIDDTELGAIVKNSFFAVRGGLIKFVNNAISQGLLLTAEEITTERERLMSAEESTLENFVRAQFQEFLNDVGTTPEFRQVSTLNKLNEIYAGLNQESQNRVNSDFIRYVAEFVRYNRYGFGQ